MKKLLAFLAIIVFMAAVSPYAGAFTLSPSNGVFDGCYTFTTALSNKMRLDVSGGSDRNGTNIQIWEANDTNAQNFYVTRVYSNWYSIRNYASKKAIDVTGGVSGDGVNVQLFDWNGTDAQLWQFIDAGNGCYIIKNKLGYCLDVNNSDTSNGTNVLVWSQHEGNNQKWKLDSWCIGFFTFTSALDHSMCLDVSGAGTENGTNIQLWSSNGTNAQIFAISAVDPDWFSIRNISSGKSLDVKGANREDGTNVQLYDWNATNAQKWKLIKSEDGYYYIVNKLGCCLDAAGWGTSNGTNIIMWSLHKGANQKWRVQLADLSDALLRYIEDNVRDDFEAYNSPYFENYERLIVYKQSFNHGKKYDIKRELCWNNFFKNICYPGRRGKFRFSEKVIQAEDLGNIIYGYAGNYLHFSDRLIFQGGGYAASGTTCLDNPPLYGDSETDHENIAVGIKLCGSDAKYIDINLAHYSWILDKF